MAPTADPDLSTLTSSAHVFSSSNSLARIRSIHRALHAAIDDKQARLRTQVGLSYRELLGTADAIVRMRRDNDAVQVLLEGIGPRCSSSAVAGKVSGLASCVARGQGESGHADGCVGDAGGRQTGLLARLGLLEECSVLMERVLGGRDIWGAARVTGWGQRLMLGIKVFLLARMLAQSFPNSHLDQDMAALLDKSKKRVLVLRGKLTRSIDRALERAGGAANDDDHDHDDVLWAMCAHVLNTTAGDRDILQWLLQVRSKAIAAASEPDGSPREHHGTNIADGANTVGVLRAVGLYARTLLEVQALVPFKLQAALSGLASQRLIADEQLCGIESLRLDIYQRWCGEEIQYYTPFLRHDDLDADQTKAFLTQWADTAADVLLGGLRKTLAKMNEFKTIVDLRTSVLQLWVRHGGHGRHGRHGGPAQGFDPSVMQESLRLAFIQRLLALVDSKVSKLHLVGSEVSATLATWQPGTNDDGRPQLWDHSALDALLPPDADPSGAGPNAVRFIREVVARLHGRGDAVSRAVSAYDEWRGVIDDVRAVVADLRARCWGDAQDFDEIEDEEIIKQRMRALSGEDPTRLEKRLDERVGTAYHDLEARFSSLWERERDGARAGPSCVYLLRVLRDIRANLPALDAVRPFGLALVPAMHVTLATNVVTTPVGNFAKGPLRVRALGMQRALWDDDGPDGLPVQPSVGVFGFVRDVENGMGAVGVDLWSTRAVRALQREMVCQVKRAWGDAVGGIVEGRHDGTTEDASSSPSAPASEQAQTSGPPPPEPRAPSAEQINRDVLVQWFFDASFIAHFSGQSGEDLQALQDSISAQAKLREAAQARIARGAADYYRRTSALFGLLASCEV